MVESLFNKFVGIKAFLSSVLDEFSIGFFFFSDKKKKANEFLELLSL